MIIRRADPFEQDATTALGRRLVDQVARYVDAEFPAAAPEARTTMVGQMLMLAALTAGNELEWLNKVSLLDGVGLAIGSSVAQWGPARTQLMRQRLGEAFDEGAAAYRRRGAGQ